MSEPGAPDTSPVERDAVAATWRTRVDGLADGPRFLPAIWTVAAVALVSRLVLQRFEPLPPTNPLADEVWYTRVARSLVEGHGFQSPVTTVPTPTALHGPLTVFLLAPAALVQPHGYTAQRATIAVLGALSVVVIALAAKELAGPRVALVAALLALVYPGLWVNDLVATSETPAILLLSCMLLLSLRYRREPTTRRLVLLGLTAGLLALDRAELAVLGLVLVVPAVVAVARRAEHPARTGVRALLVVLVLAVALVVPWSAYNQGRFHQTVLISNNLGQTLVGANCYQTYYGSLIGYDGLYSCFGPVLRAMPHGLNEAQQDTYFRHRAVSYATAHWHRWPLVAVMRELWLWSLWRPGYTVYTAALYIGRASWIAWSQIVGFWLLTPFALYGLVVARRRRLRVAPLVTLVVFAAVLGAVVVGNVRYRIPAEVAWVILGAIAFDRLIFGRPMAGTARSVGGGGDLG